MARFEDEDYEFPDFVPLVGQTVRIIIRDSVKVTKIVEAVVNSRSVSFSKGLDNKKTFGFTINRKWKEDDIRLGWLEDNKKWVTEMDNQGAVYADVKILQKI